MIDHASFLAAIIADPDADAPRLTYADWLEERGDPRAAFIRVQCELAHAPDPNDAPPVIRPLEVETRAGVVDVASFSSGGYEKNSQKCRLRITYPADEHTDLQHGQRIHILNPGDGYWEAVIDDFDFRPTHDRLVHVIFSEQPVAFIADKPERVKRQEKIDALRAIERELLAKHYVRWLPREYYRYLSLFFREKLYRRTDVELPNNLYHRGFIETVRMPWNEWLMRADVLRAETPLRKVVLTTLPPYDDAMSLFSGRWPGVELLLPTRPTPPANSRSSRSPAPARTAS